MTDLPEGLSRPARDLAAWLVAADRSTFTAEHLWAAVATVSPGSSGTGGRRQHLVDMLRELAQAGVVRLSGTDRIPPALPTRVRLLLDTAPRAVRARPDPWHPDMSRISAPRPPGTTLGKINRWVFQHRPAAVPEPWRERALDITGDEKALDRLGSEIDPDVLDSVLITYRVPVPLRRRERVGDGPVLLVVENLTTFDSIGRVLNEVPGGPIGEIVWGAGGEFQSSVLTLRDDVPTEIRYFGDLDSGGLRIPAAASTLAEREGLPPVRPAVGLYALLLAHGKRRAHVQVGPDVARDRVTWLDPAHRTAAARLLTGGGRLAQEACRRSVLLADDTWRHTLGEL